MPDKPLVVSADGHILEPTDLFVTRLPAHLRDRAVWEEDFEIEPLVEGGARIFRRLHTPGLSTVVWGNDYPHAEGTFRGRWQLLAEQFVGVPDNERDAMVGGTLGGLLGFTAPVAA
jgi:hypothetical protein